MKRLSLYIALLVSMLATSCSIFDGKNNDDTDYEKVYFGIYLYNQVERSQNFAMDPTNVAMRLAILINEMEAAQLTFPEDGSEPDWSVLGDVKIGGYTYNKKRLLMGSSSDVAIKKEGDKYIITYGENGLHTSGYKDTAYRKGSYVINTSGNANILSSSESSKWEIAIDGKKMTYALEKNDKESTYECTNNTTSLWSTGSGEFAYSVSDVNIYVVDPAIEKEEDKKYSDWATEGTIEFEEFSALSIEDTIGSNVLLSIPEAGGTGVDQYDYTYYTTSPIIYNFLSGANLKYGGSEFVDTTSNIFPSSIVTVDTYSNGLQMVNYNGTSYLYDDELYFYDDYESNNKLEDADEEDYLEQQKEEDEM